MTRAAVFVASVGVLCLTVSARAEPIRITGGSLTFPEGGPNRLGTLSIVGNRGFSAEGGVSSGETNVGPAHCFPCPADLTISTGTAIFGAAFGGGTVTLDGHTYEEVNTEPHPLVDHLGLLLDGTIHIPAWRNEPVTISAPFAATGNFIHNVGAPHTFNVPIRGSGGTVTLNLLPEPTIGLWDVGAFRYDFVATPTPEPATFGLVAGALVVLRARTRHR